MQGLLRIALGPAFFLRVFCWRAFGVNSWRVVVGGRIDYDKNILQII